MRRIIVLVAAFILVLHGLIHLMGTAVYARHTHFDELAYKTTLLNGRWDLGDSGIRIFGWVWALPAIGFMLAALALPLGLGWWKPVLIAATLISLPITALDWSNAFMGTIVDTAIIAALVLAPRFVAWIS